jgi:hypothetical protein
MNSKVSIATVVLLLCGAMLVAGCTSTSTQQATPQPTFLVSATAIATAQPSATAGPSDVAKYFEGLLVSQMQYSIVQPLTHSINRVGNDVYSGTAARGTVTSAVTIETTDNVHDTQLRGQDYINAFKAAGYVTRDDRVDFWSGTKGMKEAQVIVDTTDMYVMTFETI